MNSRGILLGIGILAMVVAGTAAKGTKLTNPLISENTMGTMSTVSLTGPLDNNNEFFQSIGSNGRSCGSCHVASAGWGTNAEEIQARFDRTQGLDPIFRTVDGANCPSADVSTLEARRSAYSLLREKGLIRVSMDVPPSADFQIIAIDDPQHCPQTTATSVAEYRRPLPSTNLPFLTTVMWDGRESVPGATLRENLIRQAFDATMGHAQAGSAPSAEQLQKIVDLETKIYTAQVTTKGAGSLSAGGAEGGADYLTKQEFYEGINDVLGADPNGKPFDSNTFTMYAAWKDSNNPHRATVARGEELFNNFPILITGVAGLNDQPGLSAVNGSCTTCHDSPNVGHHSVALAIGIGIADYPAHNLDISGLPVYTVKCINSGAIKQVTDLGRAMVTGKCADVGKTKGPILRGLAGRAPYFHNGGAKTLHDAVEFYNQRFHMGLSDQQKDDLVAFLETL